MVVEIDKPAVFDNFMEDAELLGESIDMFLERAPQRLAALAEAVAVENSEMINVEAHTIKGMIGIFSIGEIFEQAKKLEFMGRENNLASLEAEFRKFEGQLAELNSLLRDWRNTL